MSDGTGGSFLTSGTPAGGNAAPPPDTTTAQGTLDAVVDGPPEYIPSKYWDAEKRAPRVEDLGRGYQNLEKLLGREKVPVPLGDDDTEGWERVYKALGRPANPEEYKLPDLESAKAYHKLGLTARQATGLSTWQDTLKAAQEQKAKDESTAERAQQLAAVRKDWGGEFEENVRLGKRAVREFGLEGSVEALEAALGSGKLLKLTARLGRGLKEDSFAGGSVPAAGMTKQAAKEELALLQNDKAFAKRYLSGETAAVKRLTELHQIAFE
jgi:hypothetical protein